MTITVNPGYKNVESIAGGTIWYTMETKDVISSFSFKLRNEKNRIGINQKPKHLLWIINQGNLYFTILNAQDINRIEITF